VLLLDAGNALWKVGAPADADTRKRAAFVLTTMGRLGTAAMAAGARDLVAGAGWLRAQAERAKVPVLSANLVDPKGKPLFPASTLVEIAGKKIAVIGATPASQFEGARGGPIAAAVIAEAKKVRPKSDVVVVLAAVPYADALQLSREAGNAVDFILQSHEGRGQGPLQRGEGNWVARTGERGRQLGRLAIDLGSAGPFVDSGQIGRDQQAVAMLDTQIAQVKKRIELASDERGKSALQETLRQFTERRNQVSLDLQSAQKAGGRKVALEWLTLGPGFSDDPALAAEVKRIEPEGAAH
jgi:2',3'-cyclic-nucleotide 2'-phosphodiesterase (5'-nucleotidase family)